jgi:branched-chain amino acid transport system permease protein
MLLYGVILLLVVMFMPRGIVFYLWRVRPARSPTPATPAAWPAALRADRAPARDPSGPALAAHDITVRFGGLAAVQAVSFALGRGEILALIGTNGAGKSTAFNVMTGFLPPDAGRVTFDGRETAGFYTRSPRGPGGCSARRLSRVTAF